LKYEQLNKRENDILENENKINLQQRELVDREQRLQVALSRTAKAEQNAQAYDEKLQLKEDDLKSREHECDMRG
jgi:hypothetical protein